VTNETCLFHKQLSRGLSCSRPRSMHVWVCGRTIGFVQLCYSSWYIPWPYLNLAGSAMPPSLHCLPYWNDWKDMILWKRRSKEEILKVPGVTEGLIVYIIWPPSLDHPLAPNLTAYPICLHVCWHIVHAAGSIEDWICKIQLKTLTLMLLPILSAAQPIQWLMSTSGLVSCRCEGQCFQRSVGRWMK